MELAFPDKNFRNVNELLRSFPTIQLVLENIYYPISPEEYFYFDSKTAKGTQKYCMTFKEENDSMGILGAFNMRNKDVYFNRNQQKVLVSKSNCTQI